MGLWQIFLPDNKLAGLLRTGFAAIAVAMILTGCSGTADETAAPTSPPTHAPAMTPTPTPAPIATNSPEHLDQPEAGETPAQPENDVQSPPESREPVQFTIRYPGTTKETAGDELTVSVGDDYIDVSEPQSTQTLYTLRFENGGLTQVTSLGKVKYDVKTAVNDLDAQDWRNVVTIIQATIEESQGNTAIAGFLTEMLPETYIDLVENHASSDPPSFILPVNLLPRVAPGAVTDAPHLLDEETADAFAYASIPADKADQPDSDIVATFYDDQGTLAASLKRVAPEYPESLYWELADGTQIRPEPISIADNSEHQPTLGDEMIGKPQKVEVNGKVHTVIPKVVVDEVLFKSEDFPGVNVKYIFSREDDPTVPDFDIVENPNYTGTFLDADFMPTYPEEAVYTIEDTDQLFAYLSLVQQWQIYTFHSGEDLSFKDFVYHIDDLKTTVVIPTGHYNDGNLSYKEVELKFPLELHHIRGAVPIAPDGSEAAPIYKYSVSSGQGYGFDIEVSGDGHKVTEISYFAPWYDNLLHKRDPYNYYYNILDVILRPFSKTVLYYPPETVKGAVNSLNNKRGYGRLADSYGSRRSLEPIYNSFDIQAALIRNIRITDLPDPNNNDEVMEHIEFMKENIGRYINILPFSVELK